MGRFTFKTGIVDFKIEKLENACSQLIKTHDSYELFCLRNRLAIYTQIEFIWNNNEIFITCDTDNPGKIQRLINRVVKEDPKFCILFPNNFQFPQWWLNQVLYYVDIPERFFAYVGKHGLKITITDVNYNDTFNNMNTKVYITLRKMYKKGILVSEDKDFNERWQLVPISSDGKLVKPKWTDTRLQDVVTFLYSRMHNIPYTFVYLGEHIINPRDISETRTLISKIMESQISNANFF